MPRRRTSIDEDEPPTGRPRTILIALDELDWRDYGPWDIIEIDDLEDTDRPSGSTSAV